MDVIGITMGDPCGIGPEVVIKALVSEGLSQGEFLVIGSRRVLHEVAQGLGFDTWQKGNVRILDMDNFDPARLYPRAPRPEAGQASIEYVFKGIDLALQGEIGALVTAPISKEAIQEAGHHYAGHTEILRERTGCPRAVMMMLGGVLRVCFVTTHIPLKEVAQTITTQDILSTIKIAARGLKEYFLLPEPRLVVCALNPHAGEGGWLGSEEEEVILPAVRRAQEEGINLNGPLASDIAFHKAMEGEFDAVVSLYHDQGTIPIKLLAFDSGVNLTLGLPIVRTSPTHGTAFDIAGRGQASYGSMLEAIKVARRLLRPSRESLAASR